MGYTKEMAVSKTRRRLNPNAREFAGQKKEGRRACLFHIRTGRIVKSYLQLSGIVKAAGWNVYVDVSSGVWGAWRWDTAGVYDIIRLPYPQFADLTEFLITGVVKAFGSSVLIMAYFSETIFAECIQDNDLEQNGVPFLSIKGQGNTIISDFASLHEELHRNGWGLDSNDFFFKVDCNGQGVQTLTVLHLPSVTHFHMLPANDLEYLTLTTGDLFKVRYAKKGTRFSNTSNDAMYSIGRAVLVEQFDSA